MADLSFSRVVEFARDLIRIPGPPGGEGDVAARVLLELERLGYDDVWADGAGNVIGRVRGRGEAPPVMASCHLDVVDPGDARAWERPPFGGEVDGGFLHGRGAMDIKGPLAIQTYAVASLRAERPAGDFLVAHTVLEERGGWGMEHLLSAGEVAPEAVVIGEATGGDICIGHRGRAEILVEIRGVAGHASAPGRAMSALDPLGQTLDAVRELDGVLSRNPDPLLGPATIVATGVDVAPASRNVIPDRVRLTLDWRVLPETTADDAAERVRSWLEERVVTGEGRTLEVALGTERQRTYTGMEAIRRLFTPGFLMEPSHPVARAAARAVAEGTGRTPAVRPWTFATDGGHSCGIHGIPTVGFAPGEERFAHTNRERLDLASAEEAYRAYPGLLRAVQSAVVS